MARVKCIMMQRDESTLLEPWLRYNGYLFGFENLVVFDNGSTLTSTTETLKFYQKLGVEVIWTASSRDDWFNKGRLHEDLVRGWAATGGVDFVLPLHCDDFPAVFTADGISCRRADIHACLDAIGPATQVLETALTMHNVPGRPGWFTFEPGTKGYLAAGTVASIDFQNRDIRATGDDAKLPTNLVYLHHRHRPVEEQRRLACQKLGIEQIPSPLEALRRHADPAVRAYAETLTSEEARQHGVDRQAEVAVPEFACLLRGLGLRDSPLVLCADALSTSLRLPAADAAIVPFDPDLYRGLHADIAASGTPALRHYLLYGHAEGRAVAHPPAPAPAPAPVPTLADTVEAPHAVPETVVIGAPPAPRPATWSKPAVRAAGVPAASDIQKTVLAARAGRARDAAKGRAKTTKTNRVA